MKKILALVLALTMLMGMSVNVFAEEGQCQHAACTQISNGAHCYYQCNACSQTIVTPEKPQVSHMGKTSCDSCSWKMPKCDEEHEAAGYLEGTDGRHYLLCKVSADDHHNGSPGYKEVHEATTCSKFVSYPEGCGYECDYEGCTLVGKVVAYHQGISKCEKCGWTASLPVKVEKYEEPATPAAEIRAAEEEAMAVNVVTTNKEQVASENASIIPGAAYNMSAFTTTKGFVAGLNKVVKANAKDTSVAIYTKKPFAFSKSLVKAINDGKKDVVYYFTHAGHVYSVTIPAGTDASTILEKNGFAGPLYVGKVLGTTTLVK